VAVLDGFLRSAGATDLHHVTDARIAVSRCNELRPDLVLLDLHMPHEDGVSVLVKLAQVLEPDHFLPVIVLTADTTDEAKHRALEAGAKDFLIKPVDRDDVLLRIRNHLETAALYARVQADNRRLQAELAKRERATRLEDQERRRCQGRIRHLLDHDGIEMVFQPVVDLRTGEIVGVESLARFRSADPRPPNEWFADAAEVGLAVELELAAVAAALRRIPDLPSTVLMGVNVSPGVAMTDEFGDVLATAPAERLVIELTEHVPVDNYRLLVERLAVLRERGVNIAVDDAGAGYAGLQHIVQLRPEVLKLDRELVVDVEHDPARRAMAASMVHFADEMGALLVAEGIENQAALDTLRRLGVTLGQGFHLARPGLLPLPESHLDVGAELSESTRRAALDGR
jgi:EAL domain-containing protein (putative c-di-GMP-specific phosphodiesterase class I)/AmiR/NasT family two-component response regulator